MAKKIELDHQGIGDVTGIMHNVGVSDLSWLDVNEDDYRASEALPQQNLDIIPELQRSLVIEGDVPERIPLREHTIVNVNPLGRSHSQVTSRRDATDLIKNRTAQYVIGGVGANDLKDRLMNEFSPSQIKTAAPEIVKVLGERGLLGNVYVDASHFPRCAQRGSDRDFVASKAKRALFVLAKDACSDCVHCNKGFCASLKKRIVSSVPYNQKTLAHYAVSLASEGRSPDISSDVCGSLRVAFRKPVKVFRGDPVKMAHHRQPEKKPQVTSRDVEDFIQRKSSKRKLPSVEYMSAAMHLMRGGNPVAMAGSPDADVRRVAAEHGIIGHTYVDVDAMGGCRNALSFVKASNGSPRYIVMRSASCPICKGASDGACNELRKIATVVSEVPSIGREDFEHALDHAVSRGAMTQKHVGAILEKLSHKASVNWKGLTAEANLMGPAPKSDKRGYSGGNIKPHYGARPSETSSSSVDPDRMWKTISHLMNSGMSGTTLQRAILQRFALEDLRKNPDIVKRVAAENGVQGQHFIDPTAYPDYGRGCMVGSKKFRKRGAPYILASSSCTGCTLQTAPGWCSRYSKCMIRKVSTEVRRHASEKRMADVPHAPITNPVAEFELESPEMPVDLNGSKADTFEVSMPDKRVTD